MNRDDVFFSDEVIVNSDEGGCLYYTRAPSDEGAVTLCVTEGVKK